jgi:hypothetical protein
MRDRIDMLGSVESYIGTFFSKTWVQKNVLKLTDHQIEEMQKEIDLEAEIEADVGGGEDEFDEPDEEPTSSGVATTL